MASASEIIGMVQTGTITQTKAYEMLFQSYLNTGQDPASALNNAVVAMNSQGWSSPAMQYGGYNLPAIGAQGPTQGPTTTATPTPTTTPELEGRVIGFMIFPRVRVVCRLKPAHGIFGYMFPRISCERHYERPSF